MVFKGFVYLCSMNRVQAHNQEVRRTAQYRAEEMKAFPSPLEERMMALLDRYNIPYELQKIFYIEADDGWIVRYYIADFYVPQAGLIIEVDGKFHDKQRQHDKNRTKEIQLHYPGVEVFRWRSEDFKDDEKVEALLEKVFDW